MHVRGMKHANLQPQRIATDSDKKVLLKHMGVYNSKPNNVNPSIFRTKYNSNDSLDIKSLRMHSDIFALGVLIYELWTKRQVDNNFENESQHHKKRCNEQFPEFFKIVLRCTDYAKNRPTIFELMKMLNDL